MGEFGCEMHSFLWSHDLLVDSVPCSALAAKPGLSRCIPGHSSTPKGKTSTCDVYPSVPPVINHVDGKSSAAKGWASVYLISPTIQIPHILQ